jgi:hypothetical protein
MRKELLERLTPAQRNDVMRMSQALLSTLHDSCPRSRINALYTIGANRMCEEMLQRAPEAPDLIAALRKDTQRRCEDIEVRAAASTRKTEPAPPPPDLFASIQQQQKGQSK